MAAALVAACAVALITAGSSNWDLPLLASLFAFAVVSDLWGIDTTANPKAQHPILMSGCFLALVVAMALLGGPAAALIGLGVIAVGHFRYHERADLFLNNLVAHVCFPLVGGLLFTGVRHGLKLSTDDALFYALVIAVFGVALAVNFVVV